MAEKFERLTIDQLHRKLDLLQNSERQNFCQDEIKRLLHDLQVHQIELEMQNRELHESQLQLEESRDRYADLYDFAPVGFLTLDAHGVILELNLTAASLLGRARSQLIGIPLNNIIASGQTGKFQDYLRRVLITQDGKKQAIELALNESPSTPDFVRLESLQIIDKFQGQKVIRVAMLDITEQHKAKEKLNNRLRQAAKIFDSTMEGIVITDQDFNITAVNRAYTQLTGAEESWLVGKDFRRFQIKQEDNYFYEKFWESLNACGRWQGEIVIQRINNENFTAIESVSSVYDTKGHLTNYVIVMSDISYLKESQDKLNFLAYHDALTDLPNRLLFNAKLEHSVQRAKRYQYEFAVLFLDLDRFKNINDTLGHKAGDTLLKVVAKRLIANLRREDTVARLGGDEFIIVLDRITHPEDAAVLAEKLIDSIVEPINISEREIIISTSIGISIYPGDAKNAEDLVKAADAAMYHAKHCGKRTFRFYSPELTLKAFEHLSIEHGLREALVNNELVLNYQPIMCMKTGHTIGLEALIRWQHPQKGVISPDIFIPIAEDTGIICEIGNWVIQEACRQVKEWQQAGIPPFRISINVSARQILIGGLAEVIVGICKKLAMPVEQFNIELEITESVLLEVAENIDVLNQLHDIGVKLSIDDFGTGYSSLSKLKHFPIDTLKIDRSFIKDIPQDSDGCAIVTAINALAHTMKLEVIAEGVETNEQNMYLKDLSCDFAQGFYFNEPLPAHQITSALNFI